MSYVYVDTSVVLAEILVENVRPKPILWEQTLFSSRLLVYELYVRLNSFKVGEEYFQVANQLINKVNLIELHPLVLERALQPFPSGIRTLDALHITSILFLKNRHLDISLATYDKKMCELAENLKITIWPI